MKPAPRVSGDTPSERLSNALRSVLNVSKQDLLKAEAKEKLTQKKRSKKTRV